MNNQNLIGVGLRYPHYNEVTRNPPSIGWFEVHSENFFHESSNALDKLLEIRKKYPISLHGIGLSLGSADGILDDHLKRLSNLIDKVDPFLISEHLSWGYVDGKYIPDLLPVPYNLESMEIFYRNISKTQDYLKKQILIENPSSYLEYASSTEEEANFLATLAKRAGCKILLDINNIYVSCKNHNWNAKNYIDVIPKDLVEEIHLAGHSKKELSNGDIVRIDTHNNYVCEEVWELYSYASRKFGPIYTLLEWDSDIPNLEVLVNEANKALAYIDVRELVNG